MDIASLLALTATFYDPSFDVAAAKARLGDGTEPVELRPFQLKLAPANASEIEAIWLETVAPVPPREEPFLAGVVIDRLEPALVAFQPLVDRFGPPRELPRLKPHSPRSYQFQVKDTPIEGYLLLSVQLGDEEAEPKRVVRIVLRRVPPEAATPASAKA